MCNCSNNVHLMIGIWLYPAKSRYKRQSMQCVKMLSPTDKFCLGVLCGRHDFDHSLFLPGATGVIIKDRALTPTCGDSRGVRPGLAALDLGSGNSKDPKL